MYLPKELHEYILQFIDNEDKVYASMTCTLWANILKDMFFRKYNKNTVPTESAYDLYLYLKYFECPYTLGTTDTHLYIKSLDIKISCTINCLNVLVNYDMCNYERKVLINSVILSYCYIDHKPKTEYIKHLVSVCSEPYRLLNDILNFKAFHIADYFIDASVDTNYCQNMLNLGTLYEKEFRYIVTILKYLKEKKVDLSTTRRRLHVGIYIYGGYGCIEYKYKKEFLQVIGNDWSCTIL